jgi:hypothetical protein
MQLILQQGSSSTIIMMLSVAHYLHCPSQMVLSAHSITEYICFATWDNSRTHLPVTPITLAGHARLHIMEESQVLPIITHLWTITQTRLPT